MKSSTTMMTANTSNNAAVDGTRATTSATEAPPTQQSITRERALRFARGTGGPPTRTQQRNGQVEEFPGFSRTVREIGEQRTVLQAARAKREQEGELDDEKPLWEPKKKPRTMILTQADLIPSLRAMALDTMAQLVDQIEALGDMDAATRHELARLVCKRRRMKSNVVHLFIYPGIDTIDIPDCSAIDEESFVRAIKTTTAESDQLRLSVVRLGQSGRCVSDSVVEELGDALRSVEILSFRGSYRISDAGIELLVRKCAPSLREFEISCNQRITKSSMEYFRELQHLEALTLSECPQLTVDDLDALLAMPQLKKLALDQMEKITDAFIGTLTIKLPHLTELSLARCAQLSDNAIQTVLENCRQLQVLDLSDVEKLTDAALEPIRARGHPLRRVSLRRCHLLTDTAIEHVAVGAAAYLEELLVSSVPQVTDATLVLLQTHCAMTLRHLDVSFCRHVTEDALGTFTDACEQLRELALYGCTQIGARFIQCHANDQLVITGHPLLTGLTLRF